MRQVILAVLFISAFAAGSFGEKTVKQYTNEIDNKTQSLQDLKETLKEKRIEKERCLLEEKNIRKELRRIDRELSGLQKQREKIRRDIRKAEKNVRLAEQELRSAGWEKQQWSNELTREINVFHKVFYSHPRLFEDALAEKLCIQAMRQKKGYLADAQLREVNSQKAMDRWQAAQKQLVQLKAQQERTIEEQGRVKGQKEDLLKTTIGRRVVAEEEIKKLVDSARALEQLIAKLGREKKQQEEEIAERKKYEKRKNILPWPVSGEVIAKFGKNKHPELNTYVINNGIRIRGVQGAEVHSVGKGEVIYCGEFRSYGQMVIIDHGGGLYTLYGQMGEMGVEEDQKVNEGDTIGKISMNAQSSLYFEVRVDGKAEDPLIWLK